MNIGALLRTLLMPTRESCLACGQSAKLGMILPLLCERCANRIPWIVKPRCPICGRAQECPDCRRPEAGARAFSINRSAVLYDATMREWISAYKYGGAERFAEPFSIMLEQAYLRMCRERSAAGAWQADLVTWVPVSAERLEERGFNQAELVARRLAKRLKLPACDLLTRNVHTGKQSFKSRAERLRNLDDAFSLLPNLDPGDFKQWETIGSAKHPGGSFPIQVLLVDDIYTTGTTAAVCASVLKSLENVIDRPVLVYSLTLARS
ncbi:ComF family protein [Saccharibacillus endophyticus]|uniref:Amidophosphoribosyltransferase n=1 Tax=Saccharibacillus endophyticus TaxID=2060666 RepID=A0ABQ2A8W8_9BACL|nr:ComF family protein [Saccharibacillus endophyticus]GGH86927.1 amidophosphoribosyltransferase [Saccharibacillus endophyticus]